jgi:nucleotide-binding universal stress UspA family protein
MLTSSMRGGDMRVLYATDGRPPAVAAAEMLTSLLDPHSVQVAVLHVDEYGNPAVADAFAAEALDGALQRFRIAQFAAEPKRVPAPRVLGGGAKQAIERELTDGDYELVVMGAGNTGTFGRLILGGVSTFVVYRSKVPTIVVQRPPIEGRDRLQVVVGTDGSAAAARGVDTLIAGARSEACDVHVRSVVDLRLPAPTGVPKMATLPPEAIERMLAEQTDDAYRYVDEALERLGRAGFQCDGDVVRGQPEISLLDAVRERDADLVVVGTRGKGSFLGIAVGSVSAHLVRTAPATLVAPDTDAAGIERAESSALDPSA